MDELKEFQQIIELYVQDYNTRLHKKLLVNEDFFGDTIRIIDFLNHYYQEILKEKDLTQTLKVKENLNLIRKVFTGINEAPLVLKPISITSDEYRRSKKGVHKVRRIIPSIAEKQHLFDKILKSYDLYNEHFKNQEYLVYTNNSIYTFELKEDYFPHVIGLSLDDNVNDVFNLSEKEQNYYQQLPVMIKHMNTQTALQQLERYEYRHHSLFNYAYLKVKNGSFLNFCVLNQPMFVRHTDRKEGTNIKSNTYFIKPMCLLESQAYSLLGFHENSKFSQGYAESDIRLIEKKKPKGECGITSALFRKSKTLSPRNLNLIRLYTMNEQIQFINEIIPHLEQGHVVKELHEYQNRLKQSLFDYMNLECQIMREHVIS